MSTHILRIDIRSYWHPGTGRGSGFHLDAVTHEDAGGIPCLPGRTLKGLLRDAVFRAEAWGWAEVPAGSTVRLFGPMGQGGVETDFGLLRISDATLAAPVAAYLASENGRALARGLYREHFSTAIEHESGVAQERSLRGMRVVIPLELVAEIGTVRPTRDMPDWLQPLTAALPLITAVGAHRHRGFGRAVLSWKEG